jgi:pyruvate formate lyase activating enzyme
LQELSKSKKEIIIRIPLIPGLNDNEENIRQTAKWIRSLNGIHQVDLLPFHHLCVDKYGRLRKTFAMADLKMKRVVHLEMIKEILEAHHLDVTLGG